MNRIALALALALLASSAGAQAPPGWPPGGSRFFEEVRDGKNHDRDRIAFVFAYRNTCGDDSDRLDDWMVRARAAAGFGEADPALGDRMMDFTTIARRKKSAALDPAAFCRQFADEVDGITGL